MHRYRPMACSNAAAPDFCASDKHRNRDGVSAIKAIYSTLSKFGKLPDNLTLIIIFFPLYCPGSNIGRSASSFKKIGMTSIGASQSTNWPPS